MVVINEYVWEKKHSKPWRKPADSLGPKTRVCLAKGGLLVNRLAGVSQRRVLVDVEGGGEMKREMRRETVKVSRWRKGKKYGERARAQLDLRH